MKVKRMAEYSFKSGDLVTANYSFRKDKNEDLSFKKNDTLQIINVAKDPNWAHAKNSSGEVGLIPLNHVQPTTITPENLASYSWFHGRITRWDSESLLSGCTPGTFLVRDSDLFIGDLTLCLVGPLPASNHTANHIPDSSANVQHYHIIRKVVNSLKCNLEDPGTFSGSKIHYTLDEQDWFPTLYGLIQYYSEPNRGLVCTLLHPLPDVQRKRLSDLAKDGRLIKRNDVILADRIGRGEFGEVLKATYFDRQVAVKIYKKSASKLAITYEASLMAKFNHPNLISFIGMVYEPDGVVYLVTEYLPHGSLLTYLHSRTHDEVDDVTKLQFSIDVCRGLVFLEERQIIHRDIAARNVLLHRKASDLIAKLADFGMASDLHDISPICGGGAFHHHGERTPSLTNSVSHRPPPTVDRQTQSYSPEFNTSSLSFPNPNMKALHDNAAIPLKWTAPEAVRERLFSTKSDVWSYGILLWEIYSYGRIPYPRMMANQVLRHIESGYRMLIPEDCPLAIYALMHRTWQFDPKERPGFAEILNELVTLHRRDSVQSHKPAYKHSTSYDPSRLCGNYDEPKLPDRNIRTVGRNCPKSLADLLSEPPNINQVEKPAAKNPSMSRSFTLTTTSSKTQTSNTNVAAAETVRTPDESGASRAALISLERLKL